MVNGKLSMAGTDPYAVSPRVERCCSMTSAQNYSLWLWVPACAGTTDGEWRVGITSVSSLRTQGPIRRAARVERCWLMASAQNCSLWLWVPAYAGTTGGEWRVEI